MTPELTPAVARALSAATHWSERLGDAEVGPRHLLLALLEDDEGRPGQLLRDQGVLVRDVRDRLMGPGSRNQESGVRSQRPGTLEDESEARLNAATEQLLVAARRLAADLAGEKTVRSEHLMLAVLQGDAPTRQSLEPIGLDVQRLEAQLLSQQGPPLQLDEPLSLLEPTDQIDTARVLDANANRAREALRVIEDYCRFVLDDAFLGGELKRLRHELASVLAEFPAHLFLEARETQRDVGTKITTASEQERYSLLAVAGANFKRLQESLRCLEEYGKLDKPVVGRAFEALRYETYTLERAIVLGATARQRLADARLCIIVTGAQCKAALEWTIKEAVAGGARMIQLREKSLSDRDLLDRARRVRRWTRDAGALFIVNDRPDIARLVEADGVHVGQEELPVKEARRIAGPHALVGVSTHRLEQARQAIRDGASYIGVGPVFPSATKEFADLAGLDLVRQVAAETTLPAFAIGGINAENIGQVVAAGLRRVAVSHAICQADDPRGIAAAMSRALFSQDLQV